MCPLLTAFNSLVTHKSGQDVADSFYRYKMPLLQTKIEGKGNGIKTVFPNMADVARALNRPSSYPTKFFGCELGAQATFSDETERYIVNGAHDANRLRDLLDVFIDKFVLCGSCKNPETELIITKDDSILRDCKACGQRVMVDMRHKLTTFILKNPPKSKKNTKHAKKGAAGADSLGKETNGHGDGESDDELTKKIEAGAAENDKLAAIARAKVDEDDWAVDMSKEAVAARQNALDAKLQNALLLPGGEDDDDEAGGPYDTFGEWVRENRETATDAEIFKKAEEMGIHKKHKSLVVLPQALFTEDAVNEVKRHLPLLAKMTTSEKHEKALLGGIERLVGEAYPDLVPVTPKLLLELYQADILSEDVLTHWGSVVSKKYVDKSTNKNIKRACQAFIKWLEEASEEEESD